MPGLRHAHTLQQLQHFVGYSPPGEYLNKVKNKTKRINKITTTHRKTIKTIIIQIRILGSSFVYVVVVVVCEHGVSPAFEDPVPS